MRVRKLNIRKGIISSLLLLIIGGIIFNSAFFLHTHKIADGTFIVHAHPFNKNAESGKSYPKHKHNKIDLQVFRSINHFIDTVSLIEITYKPVLETEFISEQFVLLYTIIVPLQPNRGPPFTSFFV